MDQLDEEILLFLEQIGNSKANLIFEDQFGKEMEEDEEGGGEGEEEGGGEGEVEAEVEVKVEEGKEGKGDKKAKKKGKKSKGKKDKKAKVEEVIEEGAEERDWFGKPTSKAGRKVIIFTIFYT